MHLYIFLGFAFCIFCSCWISLSNTNFGIWNFGSAYYLLASFMKLNKNGFKATHEQHSSTGEALHRSIQTSKDSTCFHNESLSMTVTMSQVNSVINWDKTAQIEVLHNHFLHSSKSFPTKKLFRHLCCINVHKENVCHDQNHHSLVIILLVTGVTPPPPPMRDSNTLVLAAIGGLSKVLH